MSDDDALEPDMHPLLGFPESAPPVADQDTLERLLESRLNPTSAPPGYGGLARLLAAATLPAAPEERASEQRALAEFTAVMRSTPPTLVHRRIAVPTKVFTMKAAAAALVAALSVGGIAAAATGHLPGQASSVADQATVTSGAHAAGQGMGAAASLELDAAAQAGLCRALQADQAADHGSPADTPAFQALAAAAGGAGNVAGYCEDITAGASADGQGRESAVGPDATGAARAGLCRAWQAGQGTDHGRRADTPAFQALAAAAGGADKVAAYCQDVTAGTGSDDRGQASPPRDSAPSTTVSPPSSGPPADPGPPASTGPGGHGQGGPPTTPADKSKPGRS
jgi:hypothetical protein